LTKNFSLKKLTKNTEVAYNYNYCSWSGQTQTFLHPTTQHLGTIKIASKIAQQLVAYSAKSVT